MNPPLIAMLGTSFVGLALWGGMAALGYFFVQVVQDWVTMPQAGPAVGWPLFIILILLYYGQKWLGLPIGGLVDARYEDQALSWAKIGSVLEHLIVPTIVIGLSGTAAMVRRLRANLLDELGKPYVVTAKAKGVPPLRRLTRYPLRMALNPFVSDIGSLLPSLVSGSVLISVVLSLPTIGPALLEALRAQDIFLSGFILMFISLLVLVGMLVSDIALALLDPRIRLGKARKAQS